MGGKSSLLLVKAQIGHEVKSGIGQYIWRRGRESRDRRGTTESIRLRRDQDTPLPLIALPMIELSTRMKTSMSIMHVSANFAVRKPSN